MPSHWPSTSALCWPNNGDGLTLGGRRQTAPARPASCIGRSSDAHILHDAALGERGVVHQLEGVEHRARRHAGLADDPHRLFLGVLAGPGGDDLVDLGGALAARRTGVVARIADQILAADDLQQPRPMFGIGAAGEDIDIIVRSAGLARVQAPRARAARSTGCCRRGAAPCRSAGCVKTAPAYSGPSRPASRPGAAGPCRCGRAGAMPREC